jgi:salicylate hydroxylase
MGVSVGIVGAGIGGLSAALSLLNAGFDVQVYEQASALGEVGAGVQVSPNASRVLHRLGLAGELARTGVKPLALHQRRWDDGRTLQRSPLAEQVEARFGFPYYHAHRADLLDILAGAVPAERIHLGHRLVGVVDGPDRVAARFDNGAGAEVEVLVGADGIHSTVRDELFGPDKPRFTGMCRVSRAGPGRPAGPPGIGGDRAGVDGARAALRALLRRQPASGQLRGRRRA